MGGAAKNQLPGRDVALRLGGEGEGNSPLKV